MQYMSRNKWPVNHVLITNSKSLAWAFHSTLSKGWAEGIAWVLH
jgi:hypothetical protein